MAQTQISAPSHNERYCRKKSKWNNSNCWKTRARAES